MSLELTRVESINAEYHACEAAARSAVKHAIRCGEMLIEEKAKLNHGEWGTWLEENFEGSPRYAQMFMKLAREQSSLNPKDVSYLSISEALSQLAAPNKDAGSKPGKREAGKQEPPKLLEDWLDELREEYRERPRMLECIEQYSEIVKEMHRVAPGIKVYRVGMELPENLSFEAYSRIAELVASLPRKAPALYPTPSEIGR